MRRRVLLECGIVFLDELIKEGAGALRAVAHIRWRADTRTDFPASRKRQMIVVLGDQHMGQQPRAHQTTRDRPARGLGLDVSVRSQPS
jgi:hypothetical protein